VPITDCFDPATGASGGAPPAVGASLYNLTPEIIEISPMDHGRWKIQTPSLIR
jgi:hypothetical protein